MRPGCSSATILATSAPPTTPLNDEPWSTECTFVAPYSPSWGAIVSASAPEYTASTVSPISRALVSSSSVAEVALPSSPSAYPHTVGRGIGSGLLDDLELLEEGHDPLVRVAFVLDLLARLAFGRGLDRLDLLAGALPADLVLGQAEVGGLGVVDGLVLRRHDPLEGRVTRLDDAGGDADHGRERRLDDVVAGLGLPLDLHLAVGGLDVLRERERRPAQQLGDLLRDRAGVAVGRFGRREHEVHLAGTLDRLGNHLGRRQRIGALQDRVGDEDGLGGPHREGGAQPRHLVIRSHRDEGHLAAAGAFRELQGHLDAVGVGVVEDQLALALERLRLGIQLTRRGRVGDLLHADRDVHTTPVCPERPSLILTRRGRPRRSDRGPRPATVGSAQCRRRSMSSWWVPDLRARPPAWLPGDGASTSWSSTRPRSLATRPAGTV